MNNFLFNSHPPNLHNAPLVFISFQVRFSSNLPPTHQSRYGDLAEEDKLLTSPENRALMHGSTSNMRRRQVHKLMGQQGTGKEGWGRRASNISSEGDTSLGPESVQPRRHSEPQMYSAISYLKIRFVDARKSSITCLWVVKVSVSLNGTLKLGFPDHSRFCLPLLLVPVLLL